MVTVFLTITYCDREKPPIASVLMQSVYGRKTVSVPIYSNKLTQFHTIIKEIVSHVEILPHSDHIEIYHNDIEIQSALECGRDLPEVKAISALIRKITPYRCGIFYSAKDEVIHIPERVTDYISERVGDSPLDASLMIHVSRLLKESIGWREWLVKTEDKKLSDGTIDNRIGETFSLLRRMYMSKSNAHKKEQ